MKNNKLTLKSLQQQLNDLKQQGNNNTAFASIFSKKLYLFSWFILLIDKLPLFNRIISLLKLVYGKTTLWKTLVYLRKIFVIINAIIGVYVVISLGGIGGDTILANFVGIGNSYIEIISNFIKRLFNWFYNLFDNKIIPNNKWYNWWSPVNQPGWYSKPMNDNGLIDLAKNAKDWYPSPFNLKSEYTPWYKDLYSWLWIGGIIIGTITLIGIGYIGYEYITGNNSPGTPSSAGSHNTIIPNENNSSISDSILSGLNSVKRGLNPLNWWGIIKSNFISEANERAFRTQQSDMNTMNTQLYPFTYIDPYKPWYSRLRISLFGESELELANRLKARELALREISEILLRGNEVVQSGINTPGGVGLGLRFVSSSGLTDIIQAGTSQNVINSLPQTPTIFPSSLPNPINIANEWLSNPSTPSTTPRGIELSDI